MFTAYPIYDKYRTLERLTPALRGEDVYALQTALNELGFESGEADGILGSLTDRAIREAQSHFRLIVDGKAGGNTQRAIALALGSGAASRKGVPSSAMKGQIEHESGYRLGIYSVLYKDGSYDAGVTQRNTNFHPAREGFDVQDSVLELATHTRAHFDLFVGLPDHRRWALAQGAWNRPAFACYIAREEGATKVPKSMTKLPTSTERTTFEEYVTKVSKYLQV